MKRLASSVCRGGVAIGVGLIVLAASRWAPVLARVPIDVSAQSLALPVVVLAVLAAVTGIERRPRAIRPVVVALVVVVLALAVVVIARGPTGLVCEVSGPAGSLGPLPVGPIDVIGQDLGDLPRVRKWSLRWDGELRAPESGSYRLWAEGRGRVEASLDGRAVLTAEGDPLRAEAETTIGRGPHHLAVRLDHVGPGPRLRLGWRMPDGKDEPIPARDLGPPSSGFVWLLTDALALAVAVLAGLLLLRIPWDRPQPLPPPRPLRAVEVGASLLGHIALVSVMSWPLVTDLAHSGLVDFPDGRLNAWILAWDVHALLHDPGRLFQAPIFHPLPDTLAFSENLLVPAVLAAPAILLGGPVLGYNLLLLLGDALSGLGAQLLVRRVTGDRVAAFVGGVFFAVGPNRWIKMAHLHAQFTPFLPLALLALDRFAERRTLGRGLVVGLLLAAQAGSSVYTGAITATVLAVAILGGILAGWKGRDLARLGVGLLLAAAILVPLGEPYFRMRDFLGREFTLDDVATYATTPESYLSSSSPAYADISQRHLDPNAVGDQLFPGLVALGLGLSGLARAPRRYRWVAIVASVAGIVFSFGPATAAYRFLHEHFVLIRGVRALSRFSLIPVLALAVLSGLSLAGRRRLAVAALALFLVESNQGPMRFGAYAGPSAVARWLKGRDGGLVYLPLGEQDTAVMLDGIAHFRPLLNGDSGFVPRPYTRAMELLETFPNDDGLRLLRALGVRDVVARQDWPLPLATRVGDDRVYEVPPGAAAMVVPLGRAVPTLWLAEGVVVDQGRSVRIAGVSFELADGPWIERPAVSVSADGVAWESVAAQASLADATASLYADPRHGRGAARFAAREARFVRLDPRIPARATALGALP